jgi:hypothetical protein
MKHNILWLRESTGYPRFFFQGLSPAQPENWSHRPRNGKFPVPRLLINIVHGLKGFGKADFVLTKAGGQDKQNTWEAG